MRDNLKRSIFIFIILLLISGCNDINVNKEDVIVTQDDNLDFVNFIVDKLVNSLRDENYKLFVLKIKNVKNVQTISKDGEIL